MEKAVTDVVEGRDDVVGGVVVVDAVVVALETGQEFLEWRKSSFFVR